MEFVWNYEDGKPGDIVIRPHGRILFIGEKNTSGNKWPYAKEVEINLETGSWLYMEENKVTKWNPATDIVPPWILQAVIEYKSKMCKECMSINDTDVSNEDIESWKRLLITYGGES